MRNSSCTGQVLKYQVRKIYQNEAVEEKRVQQIITNKPKKHESGSFWSRQLEALMAATARAEAAANPAGFAVETVEPIENAYVNMMLRFANNSGSSNSVNVFGVKRIPKARDAKMAYSRTEFENRLIFEIYKSMVASYELGYSKQL
ncbi:hypothetical protein DH2020_015941 [Rehmannia glutinosa]|uniref:Uncharacterized protein n=1 Tax=Rehmannia glutinosa TaxID=99300 RepID=A0ABR0WXL7_REHGL